jgi:SAM-dependent methyltransferase
MQTSDHDFLDSIPEIYDTYLVPLIFKGYATDLAKRIACRVPKDVLEIATGSGVVTRALAPCLSPEARYTATDLNQPMLDHAASRQGTDDRITWQQADALNLPFANESFDSVACQFGVMFFPDRIAAYREALRVLKPHGCFIFSVWDRIETNEFSDIVTQAVSRIFPKDPPRFLARTPHGYHDPGLIEDELRLAGFASSSMTTLEELSVAPSPAHAAIAYCQGTPLRNEIVARDPDLLGYVTDQVTEAIGNRFGNGMVSGTIKAHVVEAER